MKESIPASVFGQNFMLRSTLSGDEVQRITDFVNQAIVEVATKSRVTDSLNIALLAFLNVAEDYLRLQDAQQGNQQEIDTRLRHLIERIEHEIGDITNP